MYRHDVDKTLTLLRLGGEDGRWTGPDRASGQERVGGHTHSY